MDNNRYNKKLEADDYIQHFCANYFRHSVGTVIFDDDELIFNDAETVKEHTGWNPLIFMPPAVIVTGKCAEKIVSERRRYYEEYLKKSDEEHMDDLRFGRCVTTNHAQEIKQEEPKNDDDLVKQIDRQLLHFDLNY